MQTNFIKPRLLMLVAAGTLLIGGGYLWSAAKKSDSNSITENLSSTGTRALSGLPATDTTVAPGLKAVPANNSAPVPAPSAAAPPALDAVSQAVGIGVMQKAKVAAKLPSLTPSDLDDLGQPIDNRKNPAPAPAGTPPPYPVPAAIVANRPPAALVPLPLPAGKTTGNSLPGPSIPPKDSLPPLSATTGNSLSAPISRNIAAAMAKASAARRNPYSPVSGLRNYPHFETLAPIPKADKSLAKNMVPPPPPSPVTSGKEEEEMKEKMPELPAPKQYISDNLRLVAIVDDRAVLAFIDARAARANRWATTLTLKTGDQFDHVMVTEVNRDSVMLEEDGKHSVKELEAIK